MQVYLKGLRTEPQEWRLISETRFASSQALPHLQGDPKHQEWVIQGEWSFEVQNRLKWDAWRSWRAQSIWGLQDKVQKSRYQVAERCSNWVLVRMSWIWFYQLSLPKFHRKSPLEQRIKAQRLLRYFTGKWQKWLSTGWHI